MMGNIITLPGRLGRDAEVRQTANGTKLLSFSLAVDERTGNQNETRTDWYTVTSFLPNHTGKFAEYMKKGQSVMVTGNLRPGTFVGRDGQTHLDLNVNACQIDFLNFGKKEDGQQRQAQQTETAAAPQPAQATAAPAPTANAAAVAAAAAEAVDDLPF